MKKQRARRKATPFQSVDSSGRIATYGRLPDPPTVTTIVSKKVIQAALDRVNAQQDRMYAPAVARRTAALQAEVDRLLALNKKLVNTLRSREVQPVQRSSRGVVPELALVAAWLDEQAPEARRDGFTTREVAERALGISQPTRRCAGRGSVNSAGLPFDLATVRPGSDATECWTSLDQRLDHGPQEHRDRES
jgi:hypothetical protein